MGKTPVKSRKGRQAAVKSSLATLADASFARCPEGHPLPNKTERGRCTPMMCAMKNGMERLRADKDDAPEKKIAKVVEDEKLRTEIQSSRAKVWQDFMQIPVDLKGADAENYFDKEIVDLLPFAVAKVKKDLFFGTEEQQERAADRVMKATGKASKEALGNTAPSIVINMVNADGTKVATVEQPQLPWRKAKELNAAPAKAEEPTK